MKTPVQRPAGAVAVGDVITWNITRTAPQHPAGQTAFTRFAFVDVLVSELEYQSVTAMVNGTNAAVNVVQDTANPQKVTVTLADVSTLKPGDKVEFALVTKVVSKPATGIVNNEFFPVTNTPENYDVTTGVPPTKTKETPRYGDYAFKKVDKNETDKTLQGAEFMLCPAGYTDKQQCIADSFATATSDANGVVHFDGIFLGNVPVSQASTTATFTMVESKSPAGYKTNNDLTQITIEQGTIIDLATFTFDPTKEVKNEKAGIPNLPLTGSAGMLAMSFAGVAVIAVAVGYGVVNRRKAVA